MPTKSAKEESQQPPPTVRKCGTMQVHERLLRTVPGYREARDTSENHALRAAALPFAGRTGCTKIPVVVHVVYKTAEQNISDAQIKSQICSVLAGYVWDLDNPYVKNHKTGLHRLASMISYRDSLLSNAPKP